MMPHADLLRFWRTPMPHGNAPEEFIAPVHRSEVLAGLIADVPRDARVLEVGCNVGRNLAHLADIGYERLEGLEISGYAVALLRETYPQLDGVMVHEGAAEDVLPDLDGSYDLIFTMAVLEHIHPDVIGGIADAIVSLTDDVLLIEPVSESLAATVDDPRGRQYPHDVHALFAERGMMLVSQRSLAAETPDFLTYAAWHFHRG